MTTELEDIDFERLIGDRDIEVCKLIERMSEWGIAQVLYCYACDTIKGRWVEAEPYIKKNPEWAYCYALHVIKGRWTEAECYIKKDPEHAYWYAYYIIKGRWPEAEPHIKKNSEWAHRYSNHFGVEL